MDEILKWIGGACVLLVAVGLFSVKNCSKKTSPIPVVPYPSGYEFFKNVTVFDVEEKRAREEATIIFNPKNHDVPYRARINSILNKNYNWYPVMESSQYGKYYFSDPNTTWRFEFKY